MWKHDGEFVYMVPPHEKTLVITTAAPLKAVTQISSTDLSVFSLEPQGLLLSGDFLAIYGTAKYVVDESEAEAEVMTTVSVQLWDVSDRAGPVLIRTMEVEGWVLAGRLEVAGMYHFCDFSAR